MVRGTTAQFKFKLPYSYYDLSLAKITFWQPGNNGPTTDRPLPIVKTLSQCSSCDNADELLVVLTEEETLRFSDKTKAYVQLRAQADDGSIFASKKETIVVYPVYDDTILGDDIIPTPSEDEWVILDGTTI